MKLSELLKVINKYQSIEVYKDENLLYIGKPQKLNDENILKKRIKSVFTLECEVDTDDESYIIITIF